MAENYYVHLIDDTPPRTYGPYGMKSAKDFARIGSQTGGRRTVTRGPRGPVVRQYERGFRRWPVGGEQIERASLRTDERPRDPSPRLPPALQRSWGNRGSRRPGWVRNPPMWSRVDSAELHRHMASVIWTNALFTYAEYYAEDHDVPVGFVRRIIDQLADNVPRAAYIDAARYLTSLKKANGDRPWWDVANELGVDELDTFAYYVVMQTEGTGVSWSDDHQERLVTGHDESVNSSAPAQSRVERAAAMIGEANPRIVSNPRGASNPPPVKRTPIGRMMPPPTPLKRKPPRPPMPTEEVKAAQEMFLLIGGYATHNRPDGYRWMLWYVRDANGQKREARIGYTSKGPGSPIVVQYEVSTQDSWGDPTNRITRTFHVPHSSTEQQMLDELTAKMAQDGFDLTPAPDPEMQLSLAVKKFIEERVG